jgi:hypothetical protein
MTYNASATPFKPSEITPSSGDAREYWRVHGTTWRSLFELHAAIVNRLQAASSLWFSS